MNDYSVQENVRRRRFLMARCAFGLLMALAGAVVLWQADKLGPLATIFATVLGYVGLALIARSAARLASMGRRKH